MQFSPDLRDQVLAGAVTLSYRLWTRPKVKVGGRYAVGPGWIEVDDIDAEYARMTRDRIEVTTPIQTEEWGERFFQVTDPCGVVFQVVQWVGAPPEEVVVDEGQDAGR